MADADPIPRLNAALEGRYRVDREIGEGGMATVYLAADLKHGRKVALKVLKPELAAAVGADRFLAEIETTANLQHPHILPLFDSGEADGFVFYVMPYVEGESLRDRLDREQQLPVQDAVEIATNVAEALDYAHRQGVIHRDVKPANVLMLDGKPVLADFGIARIWGESSGAPGPTETGVSLGTPYYMSPEQATGDGVVGPRSDLYSLACVLYETLTGEPPYRGSTVQAVLGKIIAGKLVPARELRRTVPPNVDAAVRCALEAVPADRFKALSDFTEALANPAYRHRDSGEETNEVRRWKRVALGAVAFSVVAAIGWYAGSTRSEPTSTHIERYVLTFPAGQDPTPRAGAEPSGNLTLALSPDGSRLAYVRVSEDGQRQLWLRLRDQETAAPVAGTEGARTPFFAPDGSAIGFATSRPTADLRVVPAEGGPPLTLVEQDVYEDGGASWGDDGYIYFMDQSATLRRVPATGGEVEVVQGPDPERGVASVGFPHALPEGRGVLVAAQRGTGDAGIESDSIAVVDSEAGSLRTLVRGIRGLYLPPGYLVFVTAEGTLMAAPFDLDELRITGPEVPLLSGLGPQSRQRQVNLTLSRSGRLIYGLDGRLADELVSVDATGETSPVEPDWDVGGRQIGGVRISPDGRRIAMGIRAPRGQSELWIKELGGAFWRLWPEGGNPSWSPDGTKILFAADSSGGPSYDLWTVQADGTGPAELLFDQQLPIAVGVWEPDGEWVLFRTSAQPSANIYRVRAGGRPQPLLVSDDTHYAAPTLSPDGRFLAYGSDESGGPQIYVRNYPELDRSWTIADGRQPRWSPDGRRLFYMSLGGTTATGEQGGAPYLLSVAVDTDDDFAVLDRTPLFPIPDDVQGTADGFNVTYDVTREGSFLMVRTSAESGGPGSATYHVVNNFVLDVQERTAR